MLKLYDTKDAVPEAHRATAIETADHKFAIVEPEKTDADVAALTTSLTSERELKQTEEKARKKAEKDLADLKRTIEAKGKGVSEEELQKIRDDEALARKPIEEERDKALAENRKLKLTDRVQALALKHGIMSDRIEDAMLILEKRTDLGDAGGIVFKDKEGKVTADSPEIFFPKLKIERPWLFAGTGSSGSGSQGSERTGEQGVPTASETTIAKKRSQVAGSL